MLLQPAARPRRRQQRLNQRPLLVGQVRGVPPLSKHPATVMASTFMVTQTRQPRSKTSQTRSRPWLTADAGTSAPSRRRVCQSCPHLLLIAARSEAYTRASWGTNPGRLCAKSREMCHDRSREWPPVVRDVRDSDADRRHSATSCTQVRLGRRHLRRPYTGARLPKVGMSRGQPGSPRRRPPGRRAATFESSKRPP